MAYVHTKAASQPARYRSKSGVLALHMLHRRFPLETTDTRLDLLSSEQQVAHYDGSMVATLLSLLAEERTSTRVKLLVRRRSRGIYQHPKRMNMQLSAARLHPSRPQQLKS